MLHYFLLPPLSADCYAMLFAFDWALSQLNYEIRIQVKGGGGKALKEFCRFSFFCLVKTEASTQQKKRMLLLKHKLYRKGKKSCSSAPNLCRNYIFFCIFSYILLVYYDIYSYVATLLCDGMNVCGCNNDSIYSLQKLMRVLTGDELYANAVFLFVWKHFLWWLQVYGH